MSFSVLLAMVVAVAGGGAVGWLFARRSADSTAHAHALELASVRAELAQRSASVTRLDQYVDQLSQAEERLSAALSASQSDFARSDAEARSLHEQLLQARRSVELLEGRLSQSQRELSDAGARAAKTGADLETATRLAERVPGLESRLAELTEALVRREAEAEAQRNRGDGLEIEVAAVAPLRDQVQGLCEALARREAEAQAQGAVRAQLESELVTLRPLRERVQALAEELSRVTAERDAEKQRTAERLVEAEKDRQTLRLEIHQLGQQLLEEKGKALLDESQKGLEGLLSPVRERLKAFEDQFQRSAQESVKDRTSFLEQVRHLQDAQTRLSADANALARALNGESKTQGDWGELVLERVLEAAGLREGQEFVLQESHLGSDGRQQRPDVMVKLPGGRAIIIDSKCSLTAFVASTTALDADEREQDLTAHVLSVRKHVKELSEKNYQALLDGRTPDFVLMFVPSEAAFQAGVTRDPQLVEDAFRAHRVVVCSPTTVLATMQMVHHVWRTEKQTLNAKQIALEAGKLVEKLGGALEAWADVGRKLEGAHGSFTDATKRLSTGNGSVLRLASRMVDLGANAAKKEKLLKAARTLGVEASLESGEEEADAELGPQQVLGLEAGGEPSVV